MKLHKVKYIIYNKSGKILKMGVLIDKSSCPECRKAIETKQDWDKLHVPNLIIAYWIEQH